MEVFKTVFLAAIIILFLLQFITATHKIAAGIIETDRGTQVRNIFGKVLPA